VSAKVKQTIQVVFFLVFGIGLILWFVRGLSQEEIAEMFSAVRNADYLWTTIALGIFISSCYLRALRWQQLLKPVIEKPIPIKTLFFSIMSGYLTNLAVPRLGEVVRCVMLRKSNGVAVKQTLGTVITERFIDFLLFVLIILIAFIMEFNVMKNYIETNISINGLTKVKIVAVIGFVAVVICFIAVLLAKRKAKGGKIIIKIQIFISGLWQGMKSILHLEKPFLFIGYSFLIWLAWICGTWTVFLCFESSAGLGFSAALLVTVLSALGPMITPGGIGLYPLIFAQVILIYNITLPVGYAAGWLCWLISQTGIMILGLCGFVYFSQNKKI